MRRFDGSLARQLDFEDPTTSALPPGDRNWEPVRNVRQLTAALTVAQRPAGLRGPDKYKVLEHRRRQAQIKARRLLDLL